MALLCTVAWLTGGCSRQDAVPVAASTVVIGVAQPRASPESVDSSLHRIAALLERAALLRLDRDCRLEPALAERVTVSPDGRTWTLTLRPALTFHDGSSLDARSAVAAVQWAVDAGAAGASSPGLRDIARVWASDPRTIQIHLRAPSLVFGETLAALDLRAGPTGDVGAGPFRRIPGGTTGVRLESFPGYYAGSPAVGRIELRPFDTPRTAWASLLRGEIAFLHEVAPEALPFVGSSPGVQVHQFLRPFVYVTGFNLRHPVLRDPRVRRALSRAVDREAIVRRVLDGRGRAAADPVWPLHWAVDPSVGPPVPDQALARREFDAIGRVVGTPARGSAGPRARFSFRCLVPAGLTALEGVAIAVQRDLLDVGVDMQLEAVPLPALAGRLAAGDFDAYVLDMNAFGLGWTYWLWHSEASRTLVDSGATGADAALEHMLRAADEGALRAAVADLRRAFADDPPALFLCWAEAARATSRAFALPGALDRDVLLSIARWQPAPEAH